MRKNIIIKGYKIKEVFLKLGSRQWFRIISFIIIPILPYIVLLYVINNNDYHHTKYKLSEISYYKDIIIYLLTANITLFGIIISFKFFLYSFIIQKASYASLYLFDKINFIKSFIITVASLIFGIISIYNISDDYFINNIIILLNTLFMIEIIVYFITQIKNNIKEPFNKGNYIYLIDKISSQEIYMLNSRYPRESINELLLFEKSNIYNLRNYLCSHVINEDTINITILLNKLNDHILNNNDHGISYRYILNLVIFIYSKPIRLIKDNIPLYNIFIDSFDRIHRYCADKKIQWDNYYEFNRFVSDTLSTIIKYQNEQINIRIAYFVLSIQNYHLNNNCPDENEILGYYIKNHLIYPDYKILKQSQWQFVERDFIEIYQRLIDENIKHENYKTVSSYLFALLNQIQKADGIIYGNTLKDSYFQNVIYTIYTNSKYLISENISPRNKYLFLGDESSYKIIISRDKNYSIFFVNYMIELDVLMIKKNIRYGHMIEDLFLTISYHFSDNNYIRSKYIELIINKIIDYKEMLLLENDMISEFYRTITEYEYRFNREYPGKYELLFQKLKDELNIK